MSLQLFNTRTRKSEPFSPINDDGKTVTVYSCGPTVYARAHVGNLRAYAFSGLLESVLTLKGFNVERVVNLTDVGHMSSDSDEGEDKLQKEANRLRKSAWEISREFAALFFSDLEALQIPHAQQYPLATDYISQQIEFVKALESKGLTYRTDDGIYFDTSKFPRYADFAKLDVDGLEAGTRVSADFKRNKTDFALWKFSPSDAKRDMEWESPWGIGFPGWHIECSAMAMALLGDQIDIHTGGIDHINVHHTNEVCQSESLTGKQFANFWMHVNFLQLDIPREVARPDDMKMSKSKGNVVTLDAIIEKGIDPLALKFLYYQSHYRSEMLFSFKQLSAAEKALNRLRTTSVAIKEQTNDSMDSEAYQAMLKAIEDDLNTPKMIAELNKGLASDISPEEKRGLIELADETLGLALLTYTPEKVAIPDDVQATAIERKEARLNKDWAESDRLRDLIESKGFAVKDLAGHDFELTPL